ncbi:hypothetical protein Tco_0701420 [Tanacetum coccineum]
MPTDPQHAPTIIQPSTSQPQLKQRSRRPKRKDTKVPQPSGPTDNVANKAVNKEMDNSLVRAATTASSLEAEQDSGNIDKTQSKATLNEPSFLGTSSGSGPRRQDTMGDTIARTRFENVSKTSNDSLLVGVNTPRSDEDRLKLNELMEFYTKLQQRIVDLENTKTAQAQEITSWKLRVNKLEKNGGSRTYKLKRLYKVGRSARVISFDEASLGNQEDASKQGRITDIDADAGINLVSTHFDADTDIAATTTTTVITDDEITLAKALAELKSAKLPTTTAATTITAASTRPKAKGLDKGKGIMVEEPVKMKKKDQISLDEELAFKLQAEEEEERLAREKAQKEEEANIVSWDNVQAMIDADYQMAQQMQAEEQEKLSIKEKSKLFVQLLEARKKHFAAIRAQEKRNKPPTKAQNRKTMSTYLKNMRVNIFVDMDTELVEGSEVRAEAEIAQESSSKRAGTELEQESIKKQKVDKGKETVELQRLIEIHKEGKKSYYQIIRADGSSKMYLVFSHMLKSFDREDLETLWKLVKAKHGSTRPEEGYERVLWGDLKTMFDPYVEDQQNVHSYARGKKRDILLTPDTITDMLNRNLQAANWT